MIYISKNVDVKLDEYATFLRYSVSYTIEEAKIKKWEVEYQIKRHCSLLSLKTGSSGTLKFKSVLQRQEIQRFAKKPSQLVKIIKRRNGNNGNTQWCVDYIVSDSGDVFITAIKCYNTFSESMIKKDIHILINECVDWCVRKYWNEKILEDNDR